MTAEESRNIVSYRYNKIIWIEKLIDSIKIMCWLEDFCLVHVLCSAKIKHVINYLTKTPGRKLQNV